MPIVSKKRAGGDNPMEEIEVRVREMIDDNWSDWLDGLVITHGPQGETVLTGAVRDQTALYGLFNKLSNLGLQLDSAAARRVNTHTETRR
jgi:hypothetical protein